jgi:ribosomal-protein-serine acetyltransferase
MRMTSRAEARTQIDLLVASFFGVFSNRGGTRPDLGKIRDLFVAEGIIAKCVAPVPVITTVEEFIGPRQELLSSGELTDFSEEEIAETTQVFGHIAQRVSTYQKSGLLEGASFLTRGVKTFQFVETPAGWRILAMTWDDERPGFSVEQETRANLDAPSKVPRSSGSDITMA